MLVSVPHTAAMPVNVNPAREEEGDTSDYGILESSGTRVPSSLNFNSISLGYIKDTYIYLSNVMGRFPL